MPNEHTHDPASYYRDYWAEHGEGWTPRGHVVDAHERRLLSRHVGVGMRVVDFGCGDARMATAIRSLGGIYSGLDVSAEAVALGRSRGLDVILHDGTSAFPVEVAGADVVVAFEVLEHLFRPDIAASEILRSLGPRGVFIGSVPNAANLVARLFLLFGRVAPGGSPETSAKSPWRDPHIRFFTVRTIRQMLLEAGFVDVEVHGQPFSLLDLPVLRRATQPVRRSILTTMSKPFGRLGTVLPSAFSQRLFFIGRKTAGPT